MATIYRKTYPVPMPPDAEIIERRGRRMARWMDGNGNVKTAPVSRNGKRVKRLCLRWHYSNIFPPHCMVSLGFYDADGPHGTSSLGGAAIWGWGTRPRHTIQKLFPSLDTDDYWELCRLCCRDDLPRNAHRLFHASRTFRNTRHTNRASCSRPL